MQGDSNLVLYKNRVDAVWMSPGTWQSGVTLKGLQFKYSGDILMMNGIKVIWKIPARNTAEMLILEDDGKLVVYDNSGSVLWKVNSGK